MTPRVVLRYFPIAGRVQPLRLALSHAGVSYEDVRFSEAEWREQREDDAIGGPYRGLPTLTWGDVTISETLAIANFLSRKLGHYEGVADDEIADREAVCSNCYIEVLLRAAELIYGDLLYPGADFTRAHEILVQRMLSKLDGVERRYGEREWICGAAPGVADFFATEAVEVLHRLLGEQSEPMLRARFSRLCVRADRVAEMANARALAGSRSLPFTSRPDEPAVLERLQRLCALAH